MSPTLTDERLRLSLKTRLAEARDATDALFSVVRPEALWDRPIPERHRIIFYLGHFEAFDWNLVARSIAGMDPFNEAFDTLFAFGIDPVDGNLPSDTPSDWPRVGEVQTYIRRGRETVDRLLDDADFDSSPDLANGLIFHVAIEHRLMHAETLSYMLHWLPVERKVRETAPRSAVDEPRERRVKPEAVVIPAGTATLGLARHRNVFGWDNEFEENAVEVDAFGIDRYNVTNGQYLEFVRSGGYDERSLWTAEHWEWKTREGLSCPRFWRKDGDRWQVRTMFEVLPLPLSWPVYVSHAEASAYARWAGKSLPTEAQIHRAAYGTPEGREREYPWGWDAPGSERGNFDSHRWDPVPVGSFPAGDSAFGVSDLLGNGWEWTSTVFAPFEGFERFHFYPGYSADFFDGKHFVMKGGSPRTAACLLRRSFRNWFQPHYPHIYATFRLTEI